MGKEKGVGFRPTDFTDGGGLLDNADVAWKSCEFVMWDYNGNGPQTPALKVVMDHEGEEVEQFFSAGKADDWAPSKDGTKLIPVGNATGINRKSNLAILINSLVDAGFPEDKIEDDVSVFEGLKCHMVRKPAEKRPGLVRTPRADGKVFEATNLVVDEIQQLPWEKKAASGKKAAPKDTEQEQETGGGDDDDVEQEAIAAIMEVLEKNPKGIDKKKLAAQVFTKVKASKNRNAISQLVYKDEFLSTGPWTFENGVVGG